MKENLKIQFLGGTRNIPSIQQPDVISDYCVG